MPPASSWCQSSLYDGCFSLLPYDLSLFKSEHTPFQSTSPSPAHLSPCQNPILIKYIRFLLNSSTHIDVHHKRHEERLAHFTLRHSLPLPITFSFLLDSPRRPSLLGRASPSRKEDRRNVQNQTFLDTHVCEVLFSVACADATRTDRVKLHFTHSREYFLRSVASLAFFSSSLLYQPVRILCAYCTNTTVVQDGR